MNVANRIGMSLVLLALIALALTVALSPAPLAEPLRFLLALAERRLDPVEQFATSVTALVVALIAVVLLFLEWRRKANGGVVVAEVPGGTAVLARESVALRVKRAAESIEGIRDATPVVTTHGKSIDILLRLSSDPDVDLPAKSREVMDVVRAEAETRMGIPVKSLKVSFKHATGASRLPSLPTGQSGS
jgi:hypothetical protein